MRLLLLPNSSLLASIVANGKVVVPQKQPYNGGVSTPSSVRPRIPQIKVPRLNVAQLTKIGLWTLGAVLGAITILLVLQRFNVLRFVQPVPQQVRVTNVSSNSFVVSWTTSQKTRGRLLYTTDSQFQKDVLTAYDAKDKQVAQNKAYENFIQTTGAGTAQINQGAFAATEIGIRQAGNYYTHFVLVENTKPNTKYYFKVDNYLAYWEGNQVRTIKNRASELLPVASEFTVVTGEVESTLAVPNPSYGTVVNKDSKAVQDALAYAVVQMPVVEENTPALLSEGLASLVNNQGGYYFDFSVLAARSGEPLDINDDGGITQYIIVESTGDASVTETTLDKNAPVPEIKLTSTKKLTPVSLQKFLLSAQAQSSGSEPVQDTSSGSSAAYADRWNVQAVLHMGCVGGNNKLLGPQGCGPLTNTTYDVYVCQCGAFAGEAQYQASAYKANEGAAKAALTSADTVPEAAITQKPCEPKTPLVVNELKLEAKVQRVNLSNGDFGVGLPPTLGSIDVQKECQDGSTKTFKVNADSQALRDKIGALFNPKVYKGLCLWKPMPFNGEEGQSLASCKDEEGKPRFPIPTNASGQQVSAYEYGKIVCGSDGGETAAENCGFGTIADDPGAGGETPTSTPTPTPTQRACGNVASGACQLQGGGSTLGLCTDGSMSGVQPAQSPKSCTNGTFTWDGSKWVKGTVTPTPVAQSCVYSAVTVPPGQVRIVGSNLYQCGSDGSRQNFYICSSGISSNRTVTGSDSRKYYCCVGAGGRWSSIACNAPTGTPTGAPTATPGTNPDGQQFPTYASCQDRLRSIDRTKYNCSCVPQGSSTTAYQLRCTAVTPTPPQIVTPTPVVPSTNRCSPGQYTRGWWVTTHQDELYPCVLITSLFGQQWYDFSNTSVAHCSTSSYYNKEYRDSGWSCNGQAWYQGRPPAPSAPTDTPPPVPTIPVGIPTPTLSGTPIPTDIPVTPAPTATDTPIPTGTGVPSGTPIPTATPPFQPTPTPFPEAFQDQLQIAKDALCRDENGQYDESRRITVPYEDINVECDCSVGVIHCINSVLLSDSNPGSSRFISPVNAQDNANLIVSDKGYYVVPRSSGVYEISIPNKGKYTTVLRSNTYNSLFVDKNGNNKYDEDTDELLALNLKEMQISQKSVLTAYTLDPGFTFVSFPYLFNDGLNKNNNNNYFYSRSSFLQAFNKDLPSGSEVTLLSRFANGSFDDTTVYRKESQQTFNKDVGLLPGQGYVVRVLGDRRIFKEFETYRPTGSIPLDLGSGWNLVGVYSPTERFSASTFVQKARQQADTFRGQIDNITQWENGRYDGMVFDGDKEFGFNFTLDPFRSYFVRVKGECDFNNCGSVKP